MDPLKYRKYIANLDYGFAPKLINVSSTVPDFFYRHRRHRLYHFNHPLVSNHRAFWQNCMQLCTGYSCGSIEIPIFTFQHNRRLRCMSVEMIKVKRAIDNKRSRRLRNDIVNLLLEVTTLPRDVIVETSFFVY